MSFFDVFEIFSWCGQWHLEFLLWQQKPPAAGRTKEVGFDRLPERERPHCGGVDAEDDEVEHVALIVGLLALRRLLGRGGSRGRWRWHISEGTALALENAVDGEEHVAHWRES